MSLESTPTLPISMQTSAPAPTPLPSLPPQSSSQPPSKSQCGGREWSVNSSSSSSSTSTSNPSCRDSLLQTLAHIFWKVISELGVFLEAVKIFLSRGYGHNPEAAARFGHGMRNGGGSCYINSVVQALRFVPGFMPPGPLSDTGARLWSALDDLHATVDGKKGQPKRYVTAAEINQFRNLAIASGFKARSQRSQEDAAEFCEFLLGQFGCSEIDFAIQQAGEVPSLIRGHTVQNHIELALVNVPHNTCLKDIQLSNIVTENPAAGQNPPPTLESIHLAANNIPSLLPIFVERNFFDSNSQRPTKMKTRILPSQTFECEIGNQGKKAVYELAALIAHDGSTPTSGHFVTYVPQVIDGKEAYVEYDDGIVRLHKDPKTSKIGLNYTVSDDVAENSYLYFYKFAGIREQSSTLRA